MADIVYDACGSRVLPGDRVTMKRLFRKVPATVMFVPGISPPHREFTAPQGIEEVGIRTDAGRVYGIFVDPDTSVLRETIALVERGSMPEEPLPDVLDDEVIPND